MGDGEAGHCISCGAPLEAKHRYCWSCGEPRWKPVPGPVGAPPVRPPPPPDSPTEDPRPRLRALRIFFGAAAIFWLLNLAQGLALVLAPNGRAQLAQQLTQSGVPATSLSETLLLSAALTVLVLLAGAALNAAAFYGLGRRRPLGWVTAVVAAGLWSLVLIGIPVLYLLLRRSTRHACGIE